MFSSKKTFSFTLVKWLMSKRQDPKVSEILGITLYSLRRRRIIAFLKYVKLERANLVYIMSSKC